MRAENQYKKFLIAAASLIIIFYILYTLRTVLTPFLISFCLAYFLDPFADKLEEWHVHRTAGIFILILLTGTFIFVSVLLLFPLIKAQIEDVVNNIPGYIHRIQLWIVPAADRIAIGNSKSIQSIIETGLKDLGDIPLTLLSSVTSYTWNAISSVASFIITSVSLLVIPVATFYMLRDIDKIKERCVSCIPPEYTEESMSILKEINGVIENFVRGQVTVSLILTVLYSIGLYLCGTPMWIVIGIIAGFANIVPFMGLIIGMVPAMIITFLQYHDWQHILGVLAVFAVVQGLEGILITPKIIGNRLGLHPLAIIFAVFLGGTVFGFLGVLLAVPAAAVINVCIKRYSNTL